jgi:predicted metal-dependent peptidase
MISVEAAGTLRIAVKRMVKAHPFHAHVLSMARIEEDTTIDTMAVTVRGGRVVFLYNPTFVLAHDLTSLVGVLNHEVLHVVFGHLFSDPARYPNRRARIIAEEVTVNEWVREALPGNPILLKDFPQLPPMEDTDTRYQRLARDGGGAPELAPLDDHDIWEEVQEAGLVGEAAVLSIVRRAVEALTPDEMARIPADLLDAISEAARGKAAGRSVEMVPSAPRAALSWKAVLRRFAGRTATPEATYLRPPRRFPHLVGIVPGRTRRPEKPRVMAVIDTSGSMTPDLLAQIDGELSKMGKHYEIVVVECDAEINRTYPYEGKIERVHGRGGTDLRPPFERAVLARLRPDVVVYFTDGGGPACDRPPRVPVLWCLTPGGTPPAPWGRRVWMT